MATITLLDGSLTLSIFYEEVDQKFEDNICMCFKEDCPEDEKLFKADEVSMFLTPEQVALIILELNRAMQAHRQNNQP